MAIAKVSYTQFNKAGWTITTGAGNYNLPRDYVDTLYGPGWPVQPVTRPEDSDLPRTLDYPIGVNYTLQPRIGYAGLMPIAALKAAYSNVAEVAMPVNLIIRELSGFTPMLRDKKTQLRVKTGHPYIWMTITPDRVVPFNVWMTKYKKSAKMYAAPCFYIKKDGDATIAMEYIDGSTFFLIINARGDLPMPDEYDEEVIKFARQVQQAMTDGDRTVLQGMPELARTYLAKQQDRVRKGKPLATTTPAYTQIIKGVPFSFWDKNQVYFTPEPPAPAVDSPYGESYIERAWTWINIIATMTAFELGHYRTGNTPEGLMMLPKDMFPSMAKLATGEREWNARMADGSQVQHARNRWMPEGTQYIATKKPDFPRDLYSQAVDNILHAIGVPPSELGKKGGAGLGGAGFESGAAHDMTRQTLEGEKTYLESAFNQILLRDGVDDVEFYMDYPQEEIDPAKQQEDLWNKFSHGVATLNDVLTAQNKEPIGDLKDMDNVANMHLIVAGTTIFVVEKMQPDENGIIAPKAPAPTGLPGQGSPNNPEDQMVGDKKGIPPQLKTVKDIAKAIEESGGKSLGNVTYSIPSEIIQSEEKMSIGYTVVPEGCNPEEYAMGLEEEQEHAETVNYDQTIIRQIVLDHLREDPKYYTHLKGVEKIDKTDHDGCMVALFMPSEVAAQLRGITVSLNLPVEAELELPENMHLTLAYFPVVPNNIKVWACMDATATISCCIDGKIQGFGVFNGDSNQKVLFAMLDCPELPEIRQTLCNELDNNGVEYSKEHGFVPHITLAYIPTDWELPAGFEIPDMPVYIEEMTYSDGMSRDHIPFTLNKLQKHCGVCPEDAEYFGAPIMSDKALAISPERHHANGIEVISIQPVGLPSVVGLWKPAGQEKDSLVESIGGAQYLREEAAWLLDQSLGFQLVPLAYVTESPTGEEGAAVWYTTGNTQRLEPKDYAPIWIERAAVLDYLITQLDRRGKNYLTHPDDPTRMILYDNGYAFPVDRKRHPNCKSDFATLMVGVKLNEETMSALRMTQGDTSMWMDIENLIGTPATDNVMACLQELIDKGMMEVEMSKGGEGSGDLEGHEFRGNQYSGGSDELKISASKTYYHYTRPAYAASIRSNGFEESNRTISPLLGHGIFFSDESGSFAAHGSEKIGVNLNVKNTLSIQGGYEGYFNWVLQNSPKGSDPKPEDITSIVKSKGYDSVAISGAKQGNIFIVFDPGSINVLGKIELE